MGRGFGPRSGSDPSQWPIQILTSKHQYAIYELSFDRDSGSVTLRFPRMTQPDEAKELRFLSFVRATVKIPFEFHDLPMP